MTPKLLVEIKDKGFFAEIELNKPNLCAQSVPYQRNGAVLLVLFPISANYCGDIYVINCSDFRTLRMCSIRITV